MLFFALVLAFAMRVNMSMAIVAMTDKTKEDKTVSVVVLHRILDELLLPLEAAISIGRVDDARLGGSRRWNDAARRSRATGLS
ncbi:hypothetical protein RR48_08110 [Papilio machaon]|uniref:Secreted protein n=1 Tax=Papilio machaon TaxID=76193 RepID=A0A194RGE5_PAPMA|nr:hypothetical protein RR48_08110 [Papilio machaon]